MDWHCNERRRVVVWSSLGPAQTARHRYIALPPTAGYISGCGRILYSEASTSTTCQESHFLENFNPRGRSISSTRVTIACPTFVPSGPHGVRGGPSIGRKGPGLQHTCVGRLLHRRTCGYVAGQPRMSEATAERRDSTASAATFGHWEQICSICLSPPVDPVTTSCRHTFCESCLAEVKRHASSSAREARCPECRGPLPGLPTAAAEVTPRPVSAAIRAAISARERPVRTRAEPWRQLRAGRARVAALRLQPDSESPQRLELPPRVRIQHETPPLPPAVENALSWAADRSERRRREQVEIFGFGSRPSDRELQDQLWLAAMRSDSAPAPLSSPKQQLLLPSPPPPSEPRASRSPRPPSGSQQQQQQQQPSSVSDRTAQSGLMPPFYRRRASGWLRAYQEVAESRYCMVYRPTIVRTSY